MATDRRSGFLRSCALVTTILLVTCCAFSAPGWWMLVRSEADVEPGRPTQIEIPVGSSTQEIAALLAESGVVANSSMFLIRSRLAGADGSLKAGVYDMATGMPYDVVIDLLVDGPPITYVTIVIPEGFTIEQIAQRVEKQVGIPADEFTSLAKTGADSFGRDYLSGHGGSLEGYLFPKTYRVREGSTASEIIEVMIRQFEQETADLDMTHARSRGVDLHGVVTIASMIEKEAKLDAERPVIASVIYNRLAKKMYLEIDATIEYVLPGHRFRLRNQDLKTDSRYNTYLYKGLPPGPIASPGLASLRAAAAPAETDYIYYVLTGEDGSHTFTVTFAEFEEAKRRSKEVFGR